MSLLEALRTIGEDEEAPITPRLQELTFGHLCLILHSLKRAQGLDVNLVKVGCECDAGMTSDSRRQSCQTSLRLASALRRGLCHWG